MGEVPLQGSDLKDPPPHAGVELHNPTLKIRSFPARVVPPLALALSGSLLHSGDCEGFSASKSGEFRDQIL